MPAIVTLAHNLPAWSDITIGRMREYADRIGAEFVLLQPDNYNGFMDRAALFRNAAMLYGRVALIDADCVVSRESPDIFAMHEPGRVWMVQDAPAGQDGALYRWQDMLFVQAVRGGCNWISGYGNMGVVVCDSMHAQAFDDWIDVPGTHHDQAQFNYLVQRLGYGRGWMDPRWNRMGITAGHPNRLEFCKDIATGAFIAHAAGFTQYHPQGETKEDGERRRAEAIRIFDSVLP